MKFKLVISLIASMAMVSCNNDTKTEGGSSAGNSSNATPSKASGSFAPVVKVFDGEKYVSTEIDHSTDYFIVYYAASW